MRPRSLSSRTDEPRRLRFETLETRALPGALLWGWYGSLAGVTAEELAWWEQSSACDDDSLAVAGAAKASAGELRDARRPSAARHLDESLLVSTQSSADAPPSPTVRDATWAGIDFFAASGRSLVGRGLALPTHFAESAASRAPIALAVAPVIQSSLAPLAAGGGWGVTHSGVASSSGSGSSSQSGPASAAAASSAPTGTSAPAAGAPAATTADSPLALVDASGQPLSITMDANTLVVGAASWCSACAAFKEALAGAAAEVAGLRIVFAFGDEGGSGPGGVINGDFLQNLPGEVAFLGAGSVRPDRFPMAFNAASGAFDVGAFDAVGRWLAGDDIARPSPLALVNRAGAPLSLALDANTLVVGSATWCGATQKFVAALRTPEVAAQLAGLRFVFAFDNEGGDGPGGVLHADFLDNLPGDVAFLAAGSVRPERLPMVYNPATGAFDLTAVDALNAWANGTLVAGGTCGNKNLSVADSGSAPVAPAVTVQSGIPDPGAAALGCNLPGDYNDDGTVDAADYTVWRDTFGLVGMGLAADGSGNDVVDTVDYDIWKEHFGETCAVAAPGAFTITGPTGIQTQKPTTITWEPSEGATGYRFVLSQQPDASLPMYDEPTTDTFRNLNLSSGTYYVAVTALNAGGETLATNGPFQFEVDLPPHDQLIFVTTNKYVISTTPNYPPTPGNFHGALAADYHCTSVAYNAGLLNDADEPWDFQTIHYKAMITQATTDLINRANMGQGVYLNTAGQAVANSRTDLMNANFLAPILSQNAGVLTGVQPVWTGANADGTAAPSNCINWTVTSGSAHAGNLNGGGTNWIFQGTVPCNSQQRFYCVGNAPDDWRLELDFNDLAPGSDVPADYGSVPGLAFGSDWLVANDTLGGQLSFDGNYVNFTEPVSTLSWQRDLEVRVPGLDAGPAGLAGLTVNVYRDAALVDSEVIPPLDPGESRTSSTLVLNPIGSGGTVTYEFVRIENPNAPGAPAPLDDFRLVVV